MTTVTQQSHFGLRSDSPLTGRNEHRFSGMLIAAGASVGLWGLLGTAAWGVFTLFN